MEAAGLKSTLIHPMMGAIGVSEFSFVEIAAALPLPRFPAPCDRRGFPPLRVTARKTASGALPRPQVWNDPSHGLVLHCPCDPAQGGGASARFCPDAQRRFMAKRLCPMCGARLADEEVAVYLGVTAMPVHTMPPLHWNCARALIRRFPGLLEVPNAVLTLAPAQAVRLYHRRVYAVDGRAYKAVFPSADRDSPAYGIWDLTVAVPRDHRTVPLRAWRGGTSPVPAAL
jgi:hypothetical protein